MYNSRMGKNTLFFAEYKKLNKEQKIAVNAIEGPVMVIAGPGTGKTKILTLRIANILEKTDTAPDDILALTFTESGVYSIRKNLIPIIGSLAYRVTISTFHGFCNQVIKDYPEYFDNVIGAKHITLPDQIKLIEDIINSKNLNSVKPVWNTFYYVYPILKKISELKKDAVTPDNLKEIIDKENKLIQKESTKAKIKTPVIIKKKNNQKRNKELFEVYNGYQNLLKEKNYYDYDDMIIEVISELKKNKELLLLLQEHYQYILADEHQDANRAQNTLLELLSRFHAPAPNLFIVGDEKQAIFRFQGASLENFLYFKKLYPKAIIVDLFRNYRSTQTILNAAHSIILKADKNNTISRKKLVANNKKYERHISILDFSNKKFEERYVVEKTQQLIKSGIEPGEIAILYRDNKDVLSIAHLFGKTDTPFSIESEENILEDEDIQKLLVLLEAIYYFGNEEKLIRLMHINFLDFDELDIYKLIKFARINKKNIYTIIKSESLLKKTSVKNIISFTKVYKQIHLWKKMAENTSALSLIEAVINDSGFLKYILSLSDGHKKIRKLTDLYDHIVSTQKGHDSYTLKDFITSLDIQRRYKLYINKKKDPLLLNSVRLMTAHRAKGLEFRIVFIMYAQDKHWGGRKSRDLFPVNYLPKEEGEDMDDERRLFYVALTRAKADVYITYSRESDDGKQKLSSQFIEDIDQSFKKHISTKNIEKKLSKKQVFYLKKRRYELPIQNKKYLNSLFIEQGMSVTALNNYLKCPWKYFYINLIRIPSVQTHQQIYGIAMHKALELFSNALRENKNPSKQYLKNIFIQSIKQYPIEEKLLVQLLQKGKSSLSGYFDAYKHSWNTNIINEFILRGIKFSENITLNGKLDKIEYLDNKSNVRVIDYKTGKTKTRNGILGRTASSSGDYYRQIIFYKLLLKLLNDKNYKFYEGMVDFIEPDTGGKYKREVFKVSDEEVDELSKIIKESAKEILALSFWDKICSDKQCQYCMFRNQKRKPPYANKGGH